jgi:hypothetical protein
MQPAYISRVRLSETFTSFFLLSWAVCIGVPYNERFGLRLFLEPRNICVTFLMG